MKNITAILFDLDGTLCETGDSIIKSYLFALEKMGVTPPPFDSMKKFVGPPLVENFKELVGSARVDEAVKIYRHHYFDEGGMYEAKPYDGIAETLAHLKKAGKGLFVATAKAKYIGDKLIEHFGFTDLFTALYGILPELSMHKKADIIALAMKEHNLSPARTIMIGDRNQDVKGANANNIGCVGVLWGYGSEAELREAGAVALVKHPQDLLAMILNC